MSEKKAKPRASDRLMGVIESAVQDSPNRFAQADDFSESMALGTPDPSSSPSQGYEAEEETSEPTGRSPVRYKSMPRGDAVYRSYSVSIADRQYDHIMNIRFAEMQRLSRNISIAQVIRELLDVGLENTRGTMLFTAKRRNR